MHHLVGSMLYMQQQSTVKCMVVYLSFVEGIWFTSNGLGSWPWPERLWGLKLGQRLKDVRLKGAYLKGRDRNLRKAQLDNLGFVWNPKRGRRKRCIDMEEEEEDVVDDDTVCTVVEEGF